MSHIPHWHHVDCVMPDLYHGGVAPEQITNFSNLGIDAKRVLQESFQAFVERSERYIFILKKRGFIPLQELKKH